MKKEKKVEEKYLEKIYFDPRHPVSFKGSTKVLQSVREMVCLI